MATRSNRRSRGWGKRSSCAVSKDSHSTDACDLSTLSGIAGHYSGHPIRTRSVLADDAGTVHALALCRGRRFHLGSGTSGTPRGRLPLWSAGAAVDRRVPLGFPRSAVIAGPCGAVSRCGQPGWLGRFDARRWIACGTRLNRTFLAEPLSVVLPGGGDHVRVADPGVCYARRAVDGGHPTGVRSPLQTGARKGCARDPAPFGGNPAPTLWDATPRVRPTASGRETPFATVFSALAARAICRILAAADRRAALRSRLLVAGRRGAGRIGRR